MSRTQVWTELDWEAIAWLRNFAQARGISLADALRWLVIQAKNTWEDSLKKEETHGLVSNQPQQQR